MKSLLSSTLVLAISFACLAQEGQNDPLIVAHRGASYLAPENTLASMQLAWELGAEAAECDIRLTSDNRVILFHDKNAKKLTGADLLIKDTPWDKLRDLKVLPRESNREEYASERIPLLSEVLDALPEDRTLVIEIKTGPEILPFMKLVLDRHWRRGRIAFISFDHESVRQAKALYPELPAYYLAMFRPDVNKHLKDLVKHRLDGVNLRHAIINEKLVAKCKERGLDVWCWTVNDPADARKMQRLGVSAITTDRPAWLKEKMKKNN